MTFFEFDRKFPNEQAAIDYFCQVRYGCIPSCPHCGAKTRIYRYGKRAKVFYCKHCNNTFSPFSGTIFKKTHINMRMWFYAIHLILNDKKGISGCQLQRETGVAYKTAWRMLKLIREAMGNKSMRKAFDVFVEIDETYIGGKPRKGNKGVSKRGRGTKKTPVIGVKERNTKNVYARVAVPDGNGQRLSGRQLLSVLDEVCRKGTIVTSDDFMGYSILDRKTQSGFYHVTVNHSAGEFSAGNGIHTNNIENFWSLVKREYIGTHHHYSVKYMQNYINEMCFRQNNRKNAFVFNTLLGQAVFEQKFSKI